MSQVTGFGQPQFSCANVFVQNYVPDVICPASGARYRRIAGLDEVLELFDGSREVAIRLTVQPSKLRDNGDKRFSN